MLLFQIVFLLLPLAGQAQETWVATYDGPGNWLDHATAIALDKQGNVYITGFSAAQYESSDYDYATIKYDAFGNQCWAERYNGPGNSIDMPAAIAVDDSANVYVTGMSFREMNANMDYATVKYDSNGNEQWIARYDSLDEYATDIDVDDEGDVYVTGSSGALGGYDIVTIKYDGAGNELWLAVYDGLAYASAQAVGLVLDPFGDVCVTGSEGESSGLDPPTNYVTIKYSSAGDSLWVAKYDVPGQLYDFPTAMTVDTHGNIYVTGSSENVPDPWFDNDYATIKYDPEGHELWVARYDGGWGGDLPTDIAVDSVGNVFVTGWTISSVNTKNYATIEYDSKGHQSWISIYAGEGLYYNEPSGIAVAPNGSIFVTGFMERLNGYLDWAIVEYDETGSQQWVYSYNGAGDGEDRAVGIAADCEGSIFVTGFTTGIDTDWDYTTIGFRCATYRWSLPGDLSD